MGDQTVAHAPTLVFSPRRERNTSISDTSETSSGLIPFDNINFRLNDVVHYLFF